MELAIKIGETQDTKGQAKHCDANHTSGQLETGRLGASRHCHWGDDRLRRSSLAPEKGQQTTPLKERPFHLWRFHPCWIYQYKTKQRKIWIQSQRKHTCQWHTPLSLPHSQAWRSRFDSCLPLPRCHPLPVPSYDICSAWSSGKTGSPQPLQGFMRQSKWYGVCISRECTKLLHWHTDL